MASEKGAVASGADFDQATRRRNVPSTSPNSGLVNRVEVDDKKTRVKKVSCCSSCHCGAPATCI
jgi:dolichyl-phosphate-mannose-protein mannosyltransferase